MALGRIDVSIRQIGVLLILWLAFLFSFVDRLAWAPVIPLATQALAMSAKEAGSYMTAFYTGYVLTQLPGGYLTDRFGYRRVLLGSFLVMGLFTLLMGTVTTFWQGLVYRVLAGLGSGAIFSACVRAIFDWFSSRGRGTAMGFFMTASSLGVSVVNLFVPTVAKLYGWNASFYVAGVFPLLALLLAYFLLQEKTAVSVVSMKKQVNFLADIEALLQNRNLMLTGLAGFCAMWATWGTATWANTYMNKGLAISLVDAGLFMSLYGMAALFCKPLAGVVTDLLGGKKKMLLFWMLAAFGLTLFWFGANRSVPMLYILAPVLGIAAFIYSPVMNTHIGELVPPHQVGTATGLVNTVWQLGSLLSPLAVGAVIDATHNYFYAFATLGVGPLVGAALILLVEEKTRVSPALEGAK